jgi:hypothetical protein
MSNLTTTSPDIVQRVEHLHETFERQGGDAIETAEQLGSILAEVKGNSKHGVWSKWCKECLSFSVTTANTYITLYHRLHDQQLSNQKRAALMRGELTIREAVKDETKKAGGGKTSEACAIATGAAGEPAASTNPVSPDTSAEPATDEVSSCGLAPDSEPACAVTAEIETDKLGVPLTDAVRDAFDGVPMLEDIISELIGLAKTLNKLRKEPCGLFIAEGLVDDIKSVAHKISERTPYSVTPPEFIADFPERDISRCGWCTERHWTVNIPDKYKPTDGD